MSENTVKAKATLTASNLVLFVQLCGCSPLEIDLAVTGHADGYVLSKSLLSGYSPDWRHLGEDFKNEIEKAIDYVVGGALEKRSRAYADGKVPEAGTEWECSVGFEEVATLASEPTPDSVDEPVAVTPSEVPASEGSAPNEQAGSFDGAQDDGLKGEGPVLPGSPVAVTPGPAAEPPPEVAKATEDVG